MGTKIFNKTEKWENEMEMQVRNMLSRSSNSSLIFTFNFQLQPKYWVNPVSHQNMLPAYCQIIGVWTVKVLLYALTGQLCLKYCIVIGSYKISQQKGNTIWSMLLFFLQGCIKYEFPSFYYTLVSNYIFGKKHRSIGMKTTPFYWAIYIGHNRSVTNL